MHVPPEFVEQVQLYEMESGEICNILFQTQGQSMRVFVLYDADRLQEEEYLCFDPHRSNVVPNLHRADHTKHPAVQSTQLSHHGFDALCIVADFTKTDQYKLAVFIK